MNCSVFTKSRKFFQGCAILERLNVLVGGNQLNGFKDNMRAYLADKRLARMLSEIRTQKSCPPSRIIPALTYTFLSTAIKLLKIVLK